MESCDLPFSIYDEFEKNARQFLCGTCHEKKKNNHLIAWNRVCKVKKRGSWVSAMLDYKMKG